jgi:hypothetical protein
LAAFIKPDSLATTMPVKFDCLPEDPREVGPIKIKIVTGTEPGVQLPAEASAALVTSLGLLPQQTLFLTH